LLVVIAIIGALAAIGLPALRGLGESSAVEAAKRQLLDDLALARLRAINERTTVYMLFAPPGIHREAGVPVATNLIPYQYTSYALYAERSIGDQPGAPVRPRYLIEWRQLPDKMFFDTNKYIRTTGPGITNAGYGPFAYGQFWYMDRHMTNMRHFPYLAFNSQGRLLRNLGQNYDEFIPLGKGSIFFGNNGQPDIVETPPGNRTNNVVQINWLTGRARVVPQELP
jgi:hypothetical protein